MLLLKPQLISLQLMILLVIASPNFEVLTGMEAHNHLRLNLLSSLPESLTLLPFLNIEYSNTNLSQTLFLIPFLIPWTNPVLCFTHLASTPLPNPCTLTTTAYLITLTRILSHTNNHTPLIKQLPQYLPIQPLTSHLLP